MEAAILAILRAVGVLIEQLQELGAEVTDLKIACQVEADRIRRRQAKNEAEAAEAMGLDGTVPTDGTAGPGGPAF